MPVYVYEVIRPDGRSGARFEIKQKISDPVLRKHPATGQPVRRVFFPPALPQNRFEKACKYFAKEDKKKADLKKRKQD